MDYVGNIIRPPSEADSIILQVTVGCSYNKCTFCGAYKDVSFQIKDSQTIIDDLLFASNHCHKQKRLFLADGDVFSLSSKRLRRLLLLIKAHLPWVNRISSYATARSIRHKTVDDLMELKSLGLNRVYTGLESGSDTVLKNINKGETAHSMIQAAQKLRAAQLFFSTTVLLGIGGDKLSIEHAIQTGKVLQEMSPNQVAVLTLMVLDNTPLAQQLNNGGFHLPSPRNILRELKELVSSLGDIRCQFHANHASSYLMLAGRLPKDKAEFMYYIEEAINGEIATTPEFLRRL